MMFSVLAADEPAIGRPAWMPVASEGVINGTVALTIMPGIDGASGKIHLEDPSGCEIHLVPENEKQKELTWGCGEWFQPPAPGRHLIWIEKDGSISTSQQIVRYSVVPFDGKGSMTVHQWQPAGRIALHPATAVQGDVRFISLAAGQNIRMFERRKAKDAKSARMPVGPTVAGVFDERGNALGLSRPIPVKHDETAFAAVATPAANSSHVLAVLSLRNTECGKVTLLAGDQSRNPDAIVRSHERVTAIWYDVPASAPAARLDAQCSGGNEAVAVSLTPGRITTVRQSFTNSPNREKEKQ